MMFVLCSVYMVAVARPLSTLPAYPRRASVEVADVEIMDVLLAFVTG